jgi:peptide/nickel transport system substrate-binding protein
MYQSINYGREPFSNPKVRLAMNYAVDRDIITKNVLQGFGQPLVGLFAPGFLGYNGPKLEPYTFNLTKAKQLLTEAGLPNGFQFEWQTTDGVFVKDREIAEAVAAQLKQANITANIKILERATIYDNVFSGNFELVAGQWGTDVDPDRYLQWIFVRTLGVKDAAATAPVLEMMNDGIKIIDPVKRQAKYEELSKLAYEQALLLFVHIQDDVYGIDKRTGWSPYSVRAQATNQFFALHPSLKRG